MNNVVKILYLIVVFCLNFVTSDFFRKTMIVGKQYGPLLVA